MPHVIVEYSQNIEDKVDVPHMLSTMHQALASEGVDQSRIKTRGICVSHSVVGDARANEGQMLHITLLLLEGRDDDTKKQYALPLHSAAKAAVQETFPDCAVTLEVRDMDSGTYIL